MTAAAAKVGVEIGAAFSQSFGKVFSSADSKVKGLGSAVSALDNKLGAIAGFKKARQAAIDSESAWKASEERLKELGRTMAGTGTVSAQQAREFKALEKQTATLKREFDRAKGNADRLETELKQAGVATNDLASTQAKLQRELERSTNRMKAMAMVAKADVGGALRGVGSEARRQFTHMAVGATAAAGAIFGLAKKTSDYGDNVAKAAGRIGVGVEALQEMRYVAERGGMTTEEMDGALGKFNQTLGKARMGSNAASKELAKLGLTAKQLSQMPADQAMALVADRLELVENKYDKAAISAALFGKEAGPKLLVALAGGSKAINAMRKEAQDLGFVLSEEATKDAEAFNDALGDSQKVLKGLAFTFGVQLMPVVTAGMIRFKELVIENRDQIQVFARDFAQGLKDVLPKIGDIARDMASMLAGVREVTTAVAGMVGGWKNLGIILVGLKLAPLILTVGKLGLAIGLATKGLLLFVTATGTTGAALGALGLGFKAFAVGAIAAIKGVSLAIMTNPIGLAITAVAAVVIGAGVAIYKNWDAIKNGLASIFQWIADKAEAIFKVVGAVSGAVKAVGGGIGSAWGSVKSAVGLGGVDESPSGMPAAPPGAQVPAVAASGGARSVSVDNSINAPIQIYAAPGTDEAAVAEQVKRELARHQREQEARSRGRMTDPLGY